MNKGNRNAKAVFESSTLPLELFVTSRTRGSARGSMCAGTVGIVGFPHELAAVFKGNLLRDRNISAAQDVVSRTERYSAGIYDPPRFHSRRSFSYNSFPKDFSYQQMSECHQARSNAHAHRIPPPSYHPNSPLRTKASALSTATPRSLVWLSRLLGISYPPHHLLPATHSQDLTILGR